MSLKKIILPACFFCICQISAIADMNLMVTMNGGEVLSVPLSDNPKTTFEDANMVITCKGGIRISMPRSDVRRQTYSDDISQANVLISGDDLTVSAGSFAFDELTMPESTTLTFNVPDAAEYGSINAGIANISTENVFANFSGYTPADGDTFALMTGAKCDTISAQNLSEEYMLDTSAFTSEGKVIIRTTSNIIEIETDATNNDDNRIFNLKGQYLGTNPQNLSKGIYIINGHKVIIK